MTEHTSGGATSTMADSARTEGRRLADEAKSEVRTAYNEIGHRMRGEADGQARRAAGGLRGFADELERMSQSADGMASEWAYQGSQRIDSFADRLEAEGIDGVAREVKSYARSHPTMFLAATFGAGMLIGRVLRNADGSMATNGADTYATDRGSEYGYRRYEPATAGRDWASDPTQGRQVPASDRDIIREPIPEPRTSL
jgi:hypothetical protein